MRARNFQDLSGQRFGELTVLDLISTDGKTLWRCQCDCGAKKLVRAQHLKLGLVRSCGCLRRRVAKIAGQARATHGCSRIPGFHIWSGMMGRCYNPRNAAYDRYGGRGIVVCARWHNPANFLADMGIAPENLSLDRIDNNGNYEPENCRWANDIEQNNNRRSTRLITFRNTTLSGAMWARQLGITKATMYHRLREWPLELALTAPRSATGNRK